MPKGVKGKGGKNVKRGKNQKFEEARELIFKEDGQEYVCSLYNTNKIRRRWG